MPSVPLSGPAGAAKSALARRLLLESTELAAIADFQQVYVALTGDVRGPDGRYPLRDDQLLPLVEYVRRAIITGAVARDIRVIAMNSDGDPTRRASLIERLGQGATERIVDPVGKLSRRGWRTLKPAPCRMSALRQSIAGTGGEDE